jgi:stress response protein YsnF
MKEVLVVEKQLMLMEEVHVRKTRTETHRPQSVTLRKEEVHVERLAGDKVDDPDFSENSG